MARLGSWDIGGVDLGWFDVGALASGWADRDFIPFPATVGGWFTAAQGGKWWEIPRPLSKKKRRRLRIVGRALRNLRGGALVPGPTWRSHSHWPVPVERHPYIY